MRVAVLSGGRSSEREVSLSSARAVCAGLKTAGHEVLPIEITKDGAWLDPEGKPLLLTPGGGLLSADVVFPVLHGPFGEDGTVQGLLECLDLPYVGSGVLGSAVCMDKIAFKQLMAYEEIPQVDFVGVTSEEFKQDSDAVFARIESLGRPVFVKPARLGSSVGIVKVGRDDSIAQALDRAFEHDSRVIVEAAAVGAEVECSLLGGRKPASSQLGELSFAADWYDYDAKYLPGGMELIVPARISDAAAERVKELAVKAFVLAGCFGLARADFFVDGESVLLNELNTLPGFTETSVFARLFEASGVAYPQLLDRLLACAIERYRHERGFKY